MINRVVILFRVLLILFIAFPVFSWGKEPAVVIMRSSAGNLEFSRVSGYSNIQHDQKASLESRFYVGSISKVFTAVLVLNLVEQAKLELTDEIKQLLSHSSGYHREGNFGYWFSGKFPDQSQLIRYLTTAPKLFDAGTKTSYSNIAYAKLGLIIEDASGLSYSDALSKYVLAPLNLKATGVSPKPRAIASGYSPRGTLLPNNERPFAGVGRKIGDRHVREYHDAKAMAPAFGMYSNPKDLLRFVSFLAGAKVENSPLSAQSLALMFKNQGFGRTLGLKAETIQGRKVFRHDGWFAAHRSHILIDPASITAVVVLTNFDDANPALLARNTFVASVSN